MLGVSSPSEACHLPFGLTKRLHSHRNMKKKRGGKTLQELHHSLLEQFSHSCMNKLLRFFFFFDVILDVMGFFFSLLRIPSSCKTRPVYSPYPFSHHGRNPSLNIRTEKHLCGVDVTDLPGLPLTKAKVSLARPTQWPFNQASALLRTGEQCYFLSQHYKDRVLQET